LVAQPLNVGVRLSIPRAVDFEASLAKAGRRVVESVDLSSGSKPSLDECARSAAIVESRREAAT
jgi:hypothetical protein